MAHFKVLILGGGSGGISVASRLLRFLRPDEIGIIEPSVVHFYQPLWTLVGAGIVQKEKTKRNFDSVIPKGVSWIQSQVEIIDPILQEVFCSSGTKYTYDYLIVATGLKLDWGRIKGLEGHLGTKGICSIYQYQDAEKTAQMLNDFKGGNAIFTMPPVPIKCAGAPQKIMYLADEIFRKNGVREISKIVFAVAGKVIFGVPSFAVPLMGVAGRKSINLKFSHKLLEVKPVMKIAIFEVIDGDSKYQINLPYDLLHVVPPMSAHDFIRNSKLAYDSGPHEGWMKVDQYTLQHTDHRNIFGIGDVTGIPNSKTGAAVRKQSPVVAQNILDVMFGRTPTAKYDGYSSCPLITGFGKVILAEFGYGGKLLPTFPLDMTKERRSMWVLKKDVLPQLYWKGMLKGWL